ncbi:hypothetical protein OROGR_000495 [Orobanche gracilis]
MDQLPKLIVSKNPNPLALSYVFPGSFHFETVNWVVDVGWYRSDKTWYLAACLAIHHIEMDII